MAVKHNEMDKNEMPEWLRSPATVNPPTGVEDFILRSNKYFEECIDSDMRPTLTGYALSVGLPGPTSLIRLGQRVSALRYIISRCLMAIASGYENMIGYGNAAGPIFMLKNIPDFDPDERDGAPPVQFFNERKEILLQSPVSGAARKDAEFDDENPLETYIRLIKQDEAYEENSNISVIKLKRNEPRRTLTIISEGWDDE